MDSTVGPFDPNGQPELDSPNRVYLGIFAWNLTSGTAPTKAVLLDADRRQKFWMWPRASHLVKEADSIGCEFTVPFGRWLGQGGATRFNEEALDFLAVSAGLAPITSRILLPSTAHIGYGFHPLHFAKWGASIDHISNGRWALNVVAGWIRDEAELFGETFLDHDLRYDICDEFVTLMKLAWHMDELFDFKGRFFKAKDVDVRPKPTRHPRPIFVNAGYSPAGMDFAAKHCDWLFVANPSGEISDLGKVAGRADEATRKYDRKLRMLTYTYCIWAGTDQKAEEEYELQQELIDEQATSWHLFRGLDQPGSKRGASFTPATGGEADTLIDLVGKENFVRYGLGIAGQHMVGGYDAAAEFIRTLYAEQGQEGILFSWIDPLKGLHQLSGHIIPRLKKMGLRN